MRVTVVFKAITRNWLRSRSGLFFSFLFPILFLFVFGGIFTSSGGNGISVAVQNRDIQGGAPTPLSLGFVAALNSTRVLTLTTLSPSASTSSYIANQSGFFGNTPRILVIPAGFSGNVSQGRETSLTFISSPSDQLGSEASGVVSSVATAFNYRLSSTKQLLNLTYQSSESKHYQTIDYYVPGLIAAFMMTNGVIGLTSVATEFKRTGLTKRLSATPLTKMEWIVGNVLSQSLLAILLALVMLALARVVFHSVVTLDVVTFVGLFVGAVAFSGIGMTLTGLVSDPESAAGIGNAIAFPMMFLSGTFFPLDLSPAIVGAISKALPLTYFADALRDSMVLGNDSAALVNVGVTAAFAVAFILIGARLTRWKEG